MGDDDPFILFFQEITGPRRFRQVLDPNIIQNMEEDIVEEIPGVMLRIGLNDTTLTRALLRGQYHLAEEIIEETTDIDFLNDGALNATPLNIVLGGPTGQYQQPRHLKLAKLLILKGANPNIRIPNHDLESASESPLELILRSYLKMLEVFTEPESGLMKETYSTALETELMDSVGINGELGGLTPGIIVEHTRELLYLCLDNGGDPNLPTTDAARTIFHLALIAPVPDFKLIQRLLEIGANVNHADVHNTTPLMDLILVADEDRIIKEMRRLEDHGQVPMLDNQNCTLQSALFRAAFQGKIKTALKLLEQGAKPALCTRTQQEGGMRSYLINQIVYTGTPALLAPLLGNSPCWWRHSPLTHRNASQSQASRCTSRSRFGGSCKQSTAAVKFQASTADNLIRECISPLVDHGGMVGDSVAQSLFHLIRCLTQHKHIADSSKVDPKSAICMMFGQTTAGLRQLAVRAILKQILFSQSPSKMIELLKQNCVKHGYTPFMMSITPSSANIHENGSIVHEFMLEPDSELELSLEPPVPMRRRRSRQQERDIDRLLQEMNIEASESQNLPFNDRPVSPPQIIRQVSNNLQQLRSERSPEVNERVNHEENTSNGINSESYSHRETDNVTDDHEQSNQISLISYQITSDNQDAPVLTTDSCDSNISNKFTTMPSTTFTETLSSSLLASPLSSSPTGDSNGACAQDSSSQQSQIQIKNFSDLHGLSPEDTNLGKRLLIIQMLHNMDKTKLSPVDLELVQVNPDVDNQLIQLGKKLEAIRLRTVHDDAQVVPGDPVLLDRIPSSDPDRTGYRDSMSSSDDSTLASDYRLNVSDFTCDNIQQEHKSLEEESLVGKKSTESAFDELLTGSKLQHNKESMIDTKESKSSNDLAFNALIPESMINHESELKAYSEDLRSAADLAFDALLPKSILKNESDSIICNMDLRSVADIAFDALLPESKMNGAVESRVYSIEHKSAAEIAFDSLLAGSKQNNSEESRTYSKELRKAADIAFDELLSGSVPEQRLEFKLASLDQPHVTGNSASFVDNRMQLDENWSLGSVKNLEPATNSIVRSASRSLQAINHSVEIVKSLDVNVTVASNDEECPVLMMYKNKQDSNHVQGCIDDLSFDEYVSPSPILTDDNLDNTNLEFVPEEILAGFNSTNGGVNALSNLLSTASDSSSSVGGGEVVEDVVPDLNDSVPDLVESETEEDSSDSDSECVFRERVSTLKHTCYCCRNGTADEKQVEDDGTVISYLSAQVLDALTIELGIPSSLRTCFALEVARLQLAMVLASNHAIHCDRNCEGDDSDDDNDDEDDFGDNIDLDSETDSDSYGIPLRFRNQSTPVMDSSSSSPTTSSLSSSSSSSTTSSTSNFSSIPASVLSNFGSVPSVGTARGDPGGGEEVVHCQREGERDSGGGDEERVEDIQPRFQCGSAQVGEEEDGGVDESWESASSSSGWITPSSRFAPRRGWLADQIGQRISSGSWLEERRRASSGWIDDSEHHVRRFLSDSPLPADWYYSTSSESEDS